MHGLLVPDVPSLCWSCDGPLDRAGEACTSCYRDPDVNDCAECGAHLDGIEYPYVCGDCVRKEDARCA
jgi:predicted amidophosphoribosyltransferase